ALADADAVAEESRVPRSRVGDQGLRLGQLQLELVAQELTDPTLDLLGLLARPDESEQEVVGVPQVSEPPVVGVVQHDRRDSLELLAQAGGLRRVSSLPLPDELSQPGVLLVRLPPAPP